MSIDTGLSDSTEVLRLDSLNNNEVAHSALLEVFNVPEFTRILFYGMLNIFYYFININFNFRFKTSNIKAVKALPSSIFVFNGF